MGPLSVASSRTSYYSSISQHNLPSTTSIILSNSSASSSKVSFDLEDEENDTITSSPEMAKKLRKRKSQDDIRLLAVSTHMTEISYAISDIQTRIFEIQELRHKSQSSGDIAAATGIIDQSLMTLNERLESVEKGIKSINETLDPLLRSAETPTVSDSGSMNENAGILRKHATLLSEWEAVQDESDVLREELKEDKWLTVFRTVTDQADGMMSSLEKAVNRCQEFIWQVHRRGDDFQSNAALSSLRYEKPTINLEVFTSLLDSYEAKKKHYMPATSKVLSIIDKGVHDRVTKNGETLRRHAESAQRWKSLRDRISRTDTEMESTRKLLLSGDAGFSDQDSTTSGTPSTKNGYLATPNSGTSGSRSSKGTSAPGLSLSRSISPFRKFARKITGSAKSSSPSVHPLMIKKAPHTDPPPTATIRRQRVSLFGSSARGTVPPTPSTPERPSHKHTRSYTPDSSPHGTKIDANATATSRTPSKQRWNSSTKVDPEDRSLVNISKRPPSSLGHYGYNDDIPPVPSLNSSYRRSLSRASMASSRPWSPITSSGSTTQSSSHFQPPMPIPALRTPSRAQTPSGAITPGLSTTPRIRARTPSHIPAPSKSLRSASVSGSGRDDRVFQRAFSPELSPSAFSTPSSHPPRPPSRSMIPVPTVHLHTPSRPSSSLSNFSRSESPTVRIFKNSAMRVQTPESTLRIRPRMPVKKLPPSSFRDSTGTGSRSSSRPGSRAGAHTPSMDNLLLHEYVPGNTADPLDMEVAKVVNSIVHGLLIERVDPPLAKNQIPKEGKEIKAQYAFTNSLSRKVVTCRLTTLSRTSNAETTTNKKVMCRVGGGWQDLSHYVLNRQAGL